MKQTDFFKSICEGKFSEDKIHSEVKRITNDFDPDKVYELYTNFNNFLDQYDFQYMTKFVNNIALVEDSVAKNIEDFNAFLGNELAKYPDKFNLTSKAEILLNREIFHEFERINNGELSELEQISFIQEKTAFEAKKLKALYTDLSEFIFLKKIMLDNKITHEKKMDMIQEYKESNYDIPLILDIYDSELGRWRERAGDEILDINSEDFDIENYLDLEGIFYPHKFYHINSFEVKLLELIDEICVMLPTSRSEPKKIIQPIQWLKGEESLRQFLDIIKSAGLIESRETDEIIQEHFRQSDKKPQPIQWSKSNRLLIYLFNKLTETGLVDTMDRQFKLITEHFLDKKAQPFKRDSLKQDFQNMKYSSDPRGAKTIDKIIQELSD